MIAAFIDSYGTIYPFKHIVHATPCKQEEIQLKLTGIDHYVIIYCKNPDIRNQQFEDFKKYLTMDSPL